jgi:putative transposase
MSSAGGSARRGGATVIQAYRFALDPAPARERMLGSHAGAARFAWNWGLARCQERYQAEGSWYSGSELHKLWNAGKKADPALAWWAENSKCVYQEAFRDLDRALPRLGTIRTHESTGKLARRLGAGTARILSATVSRAAQRWFVSFTVEVERAIPERHARPGSVIGVDLGVKTLITGVDDAGNVITVDGPKALRSSRRSRMGPHAPALRRDPRSDRGRDGPAGPGPVDRRQRVPLRRIRPRGLPSSTVKTLISGSPNCSSPSNVNRG